jgi:hypothetical protein
MRIVPHLWLITLTLLACEDVGRNDKADVDGDGLTDDVDCDDHDASVGTADEWFVDEDGDGSGSAVPVRACERPDNAVESGGDCDDDNAAVAPGLPEVCDGVDNNCVDGVDEGVMTAFFADTDGDGFGDAAAPGQACEPPAGFVTNAADCDDGDADVYPDAIERCNGIDDDCDGLVDNDTDEDEAWHLDADGDGYGDPADAVFSCTPVAGRTRDATDCDDATPAVNPGASERCNGVDDDCDGAIDEDDAIDPTDWYADADGDGYGVEGSLVRACDAPAGFAGVAGDCDDTSTDFHPGAPETDCTDPADYNCDGSTGYADLDADGWAACAECDDADASNHPGADERCDGVDNDCDGTVDEADAVDALRWYSDADLDGYGDPAVASVACTAPAGTVADSRDCDDADAAIHPGATELCNGADDDCDGTVDEDDAADAATWYADADGDGYGDAASPSPGCSAPAGHVADDTDCDDGRRLIHPGATEYCNTEDDDCNGVVDDGAVDGKTYWVDADGDSYGDAATSTFACSAPAGYVRDDDDCDDADAAVNPGAAEVCNSVDDDCDGVVDDGAGTSTWYADDDADGYGDVATTGCVQPAGTVDNDWDCDDTDPAIYPGADVSCPWPSCLELLDDGIATVSGEYWIDFDGTTTYTSCDMDHDGGGWTLIFDDTFTTGADPGWSTTGTYACGAWGTILGGYGIIAGGEMDIDLSTYAITHTEAWVLLDYIALDSWDGETAYVKVDGTTAWSQSQNNHTSAYGEVCGWDRGYYGSYDSRHAVEVQPTHTATTITVAGGSTLDQGPTDESFGLDNVYVWIR